MITVVADHAESFGAAADAGERGRPPYPEEALDWLLPRGEPRVLDLAAGTGKLTRQVRDRGLDLVAVDPSAGMLAELSRTLPGVPAHEGSAESIPLPSASVDVVLVSQAWHGMDRTRALPEIARVLRPGGRLGLIENVRDERQDWVRRLGTIIGSAGIGGAGARRDAGIGGPFGSPDVATFEWTHSVKPEELLDLVASRRGIILLPADERAAVLAQVRQLIATHPELLGRGAYELPYVTRCARAELPLP